MALRDQIAQVLKSFQQVKAYQAARGSQEKNNIVNQVRAQIGVTFTAATPILAVNAMQPLQDYKQTLNNFVNQAHSTLAGIRNKEQEAAAAAEGAKAAAQSAKELATKTGVVEQAAHFQMEANRHLKWSRFWMAMIVVGVAAIVSIAVYAFLHPYEVTQATKWLVIQKSVAKLILLSIASFFLVFVVRNYNTSRHNHVVNQHRAKALATFQAFSSDANDGETKRAVLMYAARAAFSHQSSGYLKKEGDYAGPSVIDLAKLFSGK